MFGSRRRPVKDGALEAELFKSRAATGFALVAVALLVLIARYFYLQVLEHEEYHTRSEANRIKLRPLPPTRGLIFDRNGKLLAENVPTYRLEITPQLAGDVAATIRELTDIVDLSDEDIARYKEARAFKRSFDSVPLKMLLTDRAILIPAMAVVLAAFGWGIVELGGGKGLGHPCIVVAPAAPGPPVPGRDGARR